MNTAKNFVIMPKRFATDTLKINSERAIQKTAEPTGDLIGNTVTDKITQKSQKLNHRVIRRQLQMEQKI